MAVPNTVQVEVAQNDVDDEILGRLLAKDIFLNGHFVKRVLRVKFDCN